MIWMCARTGGCFFILLQQRALVFAWNQPEKHPGFEGRNYGMEQLMFKRKSKVRNGEKLKKNIIIFPLQKGEE